ncbi:MAG: ComF family protein [Planctomycetia bacterium]
MSSRPMTTWGERLRRGAASWMGEGIDLFFPPRCALCRRDLPSAGDGAASDPAAPGDLCVACARDLSADVGRCIVCGEPGADGSCRRCRGRCSDWDGIAILAAYGDRLREAVLRCKRPTGDEVSRALAALLVGRHRTTFVGWRIDGVVPVPMHWLRRLSRGTSAADEIARRVAGLLEVPFLRALSRQTATTMQNELPVSERRGNVATAFRVRRPVTGRRLLVIDDVVTTGSTLAACRRTLAAGGAEAVYAAAIARADRMVDGASHHGA